MEKWGARWVVVLEYIYHSFSPSSFCSSFHLLVLVNSKALKRNVFLSLLTVGCDVKSNIR